MLLSVPIIAILKSVAWKTAHNNDCGPFARNFVHLYSIWRTPFFLEKKFKICVLLFFFGIYTNLQIPGNPSIV
jgi:hypothetical protein